MTKSDSLQIPLWNAPEAFLETFSTGRRVAMNIFHPFSDQANGMNVI